ncbi:uncharacterized protein DUF1349 [Ilumatobacter fluminis]|uniref:Uncharacterized protein DUF1349 n=1 Tax=Ilumatobacter fluminis TaxID=467091 RepID=A0A4R7I569_9ACTN|nr:ThuA domain-containing protein [Ilumatobacter fluminis]TDT18139.1 uncharacterized protein DUF1349 [Ilumatobacter fluminis]
MNTRRRLVAMVAALATTLGLLVVPVTPAAAQEATDHSILVFSKTAAFRHGSIETGVQAIEDLGAANGVTVDATEDATAFTEENLSQYSAVIWMSTTGDVLNADQQAAFESYIQSGGGYVGIHAASDTEYSWPWYADLVGAYFAGHPAVQEATVVTEDHVHPSTAHLDTEWARTDEWYNFDRNPRVDVHVLQSLDESTYNAGGSAMGIDHPITWCHDYDGGRSWFTGHGHTNATFAEPDFLDLLWGGIEYAAGIAAGDCGATDWDNFQKVTLDDNTSNPMTLEVAPDGRVFYIDRNGAVRIIHTDGSITQAGSVDVYTGQEFGLIGLALDPDFENNGFIYLTYSPDDGIPHDQVSRFTMVGDTFDTATEVVVLDIPTQRDQCCHAGGEIEFDSQGNLYIATGDNTNPFASSGYAPIDERDGRSAWDAQGTSANSNALMGKVLRITPQPDGSYTIPDGNLFDEALDTDDLTRPEIYAMGFRNPFRIGIDPLTDKLLLADYGPDAGSANANRGPDGRVEWNIVDQPGFYGWPYCVGDNTPYIDFDFETSTSGSAFDCTNGPVNDSPNNTGISQLPAPIAADQWYGKSSTGTPEIGTGGAPMAGPVYRYDPASTSEVKWPEYWDGKAIFGEWNRTTNGMFSFQVDDDVDGVEKINQMFPGDTFRRLMAFDFGPDGALYFIEWGSGFGGNNADSGIYRMEYAGNARTPIARLTADVTNGPLPLEVNFASTGSYDPDGGPVTTEWDFDGDGTTDSTDPNPTHTYTVAGDYQARLIVTDDEGVTASSTVTITAGNTAPVITIDTPPNGGFMSFGDTISYSVTVTDAEDGTIDCDRVITQPALGHDEHAHGYEQYAGCSGSFPIPGDTGHVGANIFGIVTVTYTDDGGANGAGSLTTQEIVELRLRHTEAEYFAETGRVAGGVGTDNPGVQTEGTTDVGGGQNIGFIQDGDWWSLEPANLTGIDTVDVRIASARSGGVLEIRTDAPDGPLVGSTTITGTGGWQSWQTVTIDLDDDVTSDSVYFVADAPSGDTGYLFNVNWMEFQGVGVSENRAPAVSVSATPVEGTAPLEVAFTATATDPDGDTDLSYDWTFGDGAVGTGENPTHVYGSPGDYTATVTVTDPSGAAGTASIDVSVTPGAIDECLAGRSDDFLGSLLDTDRWTVVRESQELRVEDSHLVIPLTATDIYGANNTDTPNIVLQPLPSGAVTITTKVTGRFYDAYEQGGLILYQDDDNYMKFVFEGRTTSGENAANRVFQFVSEADGSPNETNSPAVGAGFPDTAYLQLRIDAAGIVEGFHSTDGVTWTSMGVTGDVSGYTHAQMGLMALAGNNRNEDEEASFDWFSVTPDDTAGSAGPNDEFDGTTLDLCRWNRSVRLDDTAYAVTDGALVLETGNGDIYQGTATDPTNFILQDQPGDEWTVETKLDTSQLAERYQQAGLMVYVDDDHYVKWNMLATNTAGNAVTTNLEFRNEIDGTIAGPNSNVNGVARGDLWLRLSRSGDTFSASYSLDGTTWTDAANPVTNALVAANGAVGVFTIGTNQSAPVPVAFDYFRVVEEPVDTTPPAISASLHGAFTGTILPAVGSDLAGSAEMIVTSTQTTMTADLTGLEPEGEFSAHLHVGTCAAVEAHYMDDPDGPMAPPNELWLRDPGQNTFVADSSGAASPSGDAPWAARSTAQAVMVHAGDTGLPRGCATLDTSSGEVQVVLDAADDLPGQVYVEYRVGGGEWSEYTTAVTVSEPGDHVVEFRASDTAGNVSEVGTATFSIRAPLTLDAVTVDPATPDGADGWYVGPVTVAGVASDPAATVEFSVDGAPFAAGDDGSVVVGGDGAHTVAVRAVRGDETTDSTTVEFAIDATAPVVTVDGVADGGSAGNAGAVAVSAEDATSGVASLTVALDGVTVGTEFGLDGLALGQHTLTATAVDVAGNATTSTIVFTVVTSYGDIDALITRYVDEGRLDPATADSLRGDLDKSLGFAERGKSKQAKQWVQRAIDTAVGIPDAGVRGVLVSSLTDLYQQV